MRNILYLLLIALCCLALAAQSTKTDVEQQPAQLPDIAGPWQLKPLLLKGAAAPDTGGTFLEFGETYAMDDFLVFWARYGEGEKAWGLFSLKNGKLVKVLSEDTDLPTPDGHKIKVTRHPSPSTSARQAKWKSSNAIDQESWPVIHAGKRMLYISARRPEHVYGWDGERLLRVLGNGDTLTVGGAKYQVKRASVLDVNTVGQALLYYDANKPESEGWVLHDGASFIPLWKEGDELPGRPAIRIKNLSSGPGCIFKCVVPPRLLPDGSLVAFVETATGTEFFRISSDKSESLSTTGGGAPRAILAVRPDAYILDITESSTVQGFRETTYYDSPKLLFYGAGKSVAVGKVDIAYTGPSTSSFLPSKLDIIAFDEAIFLGPDSSRALVSMEISSQQKHWVKRTSGLSFPNLLFFDGQQVRRVPWEKTVGMDVGGVVNALEKPYPSLITAPWPDRIVLHKVDGPVPGVRVELPRVGSGTGRWFVPADTTDGNLIQGPRFSLEGRTVTAADVIVWKGSTAVVGIDDGYFLMEQVPAK